MALQNQFISLQVAPACGRPLRLIFEHPDWGRNFPRIVVTEEVVEDNVKHRDLALPAWKGETAIPDILNYLDPNTRYSQRVSMGEEPVRRKLLLEVHAFLRRFGGPVRETAW